MVDTIENRGKWKLKVGMITLWQVLILLFYMIAGLKVRELCQYSNYFYGIKSLFASRTIIISHIVIWLISIFMIIKGYSILKIKKDSTLVVYIMEMIILFFLIIFLARYLLVVYSENPMEEIKFLGNVMLDINEQQIKTEKIESLNFEYKNEIKRCQFINGIYPIYTTFNANNNIIESYLKKAFDETVGIEICYYENSKIINSIVIDGKIYNDINQLMLDYHKYTTEYEKEWNFITAVEN